MATKPKTSVRRVQGNQKRKRESFSDVVRSANRRAHEQANRRGRNRDRKMVWSMMDAADYDDEIGATEWLRRLLRWSYALLLLPLCWVTTWTFLTRFSQATVDQSFWRTTEFWYFATGGLVMGGWFWSGLLKRFFLYIYVLGHELTHAVFVVLYRGKVTDFHVSAEGGYITTNKTNLMIALSPYFVPFWAVVAAALYAAIRYFGGFSEEWDRLLYGLMGLTWTFHMVWTLWMIPRDQPDLRENGTFLSLVIIYLANLLVLVALLCLAGHTPLQDIRAFGMDWVKFAATWGDGIMRGVFSVVRQVRAALLV